MKSERLDLALLLSLGAIWGSAFVVIRAGILAGATPILFAAIRFVIAAGAMALIAFVARERRPSLRTMAPATLLGGVLMMAGYAAFLYWGEQYSSGGLATVLTATSPLLSALVAVPLLPEERLGRWGVIGVVVGFLGIGVLFSPELRAGGSTGLLGGLAVLMAAISFTIGSVVLRRLHLGPQGYWGISSQFGTAALVLLGVVALGGPGQAFPITWVTVPGLLYLALVSSVLGFLIYYTLHDRVGPARANIVAYVNPIAGVTLGIVLLGEQVGAAELAGIALVIGALALLHQDRRRSVPAPATTSTR